MVMEGGGMAGAEAYMGAWLQLGCSLYKKKIEEEESCGSMWRTCPKVTRGWHPNSLGGLP